MKRTMTAAIALAFAACAYSAHAAPQDGDQTDQQQHHHRDGGGDGQHTRDGGQHQDNNNQAGGQTGGQTGAQGAQGQSVQSQTTGQTGQTGGDGGHHHWNGQTGGGYQARGGSTGQSQGQTQTQGQGEAHHRADLYTPGNQNNGQSTGQSWNNGQGGSHDGRSDGRRERGQNWNNGEDSSHNGQNWNNGQDGSHNGQNWNNGQNSSHNGQDWNNGRHDAARDHQPRARDRGRSWFDPDRFRESYHSQRHFRGPSFRYPQGWRYQRWSFGDFLPFGWFGSSYYLDWYAYGLPQPPIGAEWVRQGSDAVLIDVWSGEVLSVSYDVFY